MARTYVWPYQMHGSIGPSCAVADYQEGHITGLVRHAESAHPARRPRAAAEATRSRHRRDPAGGRRLLRPQLRRRRDGGCGAAVACGRPSGPGATDPRAGARLGAQGHRATDGRQGRTERRWQRRRLRFRDALSVQRRADPGAAADGRDRAGPRCVRDGRPHRDPALRLRRHARDRARHAADRARVLVSRRLGVAQYLCPRILHRRTRHRSRRRSDRVPAALPQGQARDRSGQRGCRARRLDPSPGLAGAGRRGRHRARTRLCLCALCPQQVSGLRRGVVGLDRRRRRQQGDRRCQRHPRGGRPGFRA